MSREGQDQLQQKAIAVANTLALSSTVVDGLQRRDQSGAIQRFAEQVRHQNELLFVVVVDMQGIRYSHPKPRLIGKHFIGDDLAPALQATSTAPSTAARWPRRCGCSCRCMTRRNSKSAWWRSASRWIPCSGWWRKAAGSSIGPSPSPRWSAARTFFPGSALKRIMLGFEPYEISNLFEQRNAMLQSIKEGVIAVDNESRITIVNDEAKRLLRQSGPVENLLLEAASKHWPAQLHLAEVLGSGKPLRDRQINFNGSELLTNTVPVIVNGRDRRHRHLPRQDRGQPPAAAPERHGALRRCATGAVARIYEQAARDTRHAAHEGLPAVGKLHHQYRQQLSEETARCCARFTRRKWRASSSARSAAPTKPALS